MVQLENDISFFFDEGHFISNEVISEYLISSRVTKGSQNSPKRAVTWLDMHTDYGYKKVSTSLDGPIIDKNWILEKNNCSFLTKNHCPCRPDINLMFNLTCPRPHSDLTDAKNVNFVDFFLISVFFGVRREINIRNLTKNLILTPKNEIHIRNATLSKNLESQITIFEYFKHIEHVSRRTS